MLTSRCCTNCTKISFIRDKETCLSDKDWT